MELNQINNTNDINKRHQISGKSGVIQYLTSSDQCPSYHHPQMKSGTPLSISSPQVLHDGSPQTSQHPSPQLDQQNLLVSYVKAGTPSQSANSPFVVPSPSASMVPSPMPEFTSPDSTHGAVSTIISRDTNVEEQPLERLIKVVKSMSQEAFIASISEISSVVSMVDRIAVSAIGNGSRAAVGEDLAGVTKCCLQVGNFITQEGSNGVKKIRRYTSVMPGNIVSSTGSVSDNFRLIDGCESDGASTVVSRGLGLRLTTHSKESCMKFIDTVVCISKDDVEPATAYFHCCRTESKSEVTICFL